MNKRDYYEVLGVEKGSTLPQIKSAYRKMAKQYHPDRNKEAGAETKFKEVQEAYETLSDDRKRSAYDKYGHAGTQGFGGGSQDFSGYGNGGFGGFDFNSSGMGGDAGAFNDIFEQFFGSGFGGFSASGSQRARRGDDLEVTLKIPFLEAVFGIEKTIRYKRHKNCDICHGTGAKSGTSMETCKTCAGQGRVTQVQRTFLGNFQSVVTCPDCSGSGKTIKEKCGVCNGKGIVQSEEDFKIKIPHGIPDGVTLRFKEKGSTGHKGGGYGDLFVNIEVKADPKLERKGDDIYTNIEIDAVDAVLGSTKKVPTVRGEQDLEIPSGTQPESILRMPDAAGPRFQGKGNGDEYVRVIVKIPERLTTAQKELWEKLHELKDSKPGVWDSIFN